MDELIFGLRSWKLGWSAENSLIRNPLAFPDTVLVCVVEPGLSVTFD